MLTDTIIKIKKGIYVKLFFQNLIYKTPRVFLRFPSLHGQPDMRTGPRTHHTQAPGGIERMGADAGATKSLPAISRQIHKQKPGLGLGLGLYLESHIWPGFSHGFGSSVRCLRVPLAAMKMSLVACCI